MSQALLITLMERGTTGLDVLSVERAAGIELHDLADRLAGFVQFAPDWEPGQVRLTAGSRIGTVQIRDLRVDVRPRLAAPEMVTLIRYALGGNVSPAERSAPPTGPVGLDELICVLLAEEADRIRQVGLSRLYRKQTEPLAVLRGRPEFLGSFPLRKKHNPRIMCSHYQLTCDNLDNQLLRVGLERAGLMEVSVATRRRLLEHRRAWSFFASDIRPSPGDFTRARSRYTRLSEHYRLAHNLSELITMRRRPAELFGESPVATKGLILEMPYLFERFVERLVDAWARPVGLRVVPQQPDRGALLDAEGDIYRRVRPDVVLYRQDRPVAVIDAKYKEYWRGKEPSGVPDRRISNEDLYQLFFYAQRLQLKHGLPTPPAAFIVAPRPAPDECEGREIGSRYRSVAWRAGHEQAGEVRLINLPLTDILRSMRRTSRWLDTLESIRDQILGSESCVR